MEGGLLALAQVLGLVFEVPAWASLRLETGASLVGVAATLPLLLFLGVAVRAPWGPLQRLCRQVQELARSLFVGAKTLDLALLALLAGVCEETFFRGFLQTLLAREWGPAMALGMTAALFAAVHPLSKLYAAIAAAMSLYLGVLFLVSQNLLPPIVTHGLYDFAALLYWRRRVRQVEARRAVSSPGDAIGTDPASSPRRRDGGDR